MIPLWVCAPVVFVAVVAGYWQGWRHALRVAGRARTLHVAQETELRERQERQLASMNRKERCRAAQAAARSVARKGGRG